MLIRKLIPLGGLLLLTILVLISACQKEENIIGANAEIEDGSTTQSARSSISGKKDHLLYYLTNGNTKAWKVDPAGQTRYCAQTVVNTPLVMDDTYIFSADGTFTHLGGTVTCDAFCCDGGDYVHSWTFNSDQSALIIAGSIVVPVVQLDNSHLLLGNAQDPQTATTYLIPDDETNESYAAAFYSQRVVCGGQKVPPGWAILKREPCISCPSRAGSACMQSVIVNLNGAPSGYDIWVMRGSTIPPGWGLIGVRLRSEAGLTVVYIQLKNLKGMAVGSEVALCPGSPVPTGWTQIGTQDCGGACSDIAGQECIQTVYRKVN